MAESLIARPPTNRPASRVRGVAYPDGSDPDGSNREEPMAIAAVSISPVGVGTSVSAYVSAALRVAQGQDRVRWRLDPMFTTLEGDLHEIYALVARMQEAVFEAGAERVGTVIKIDDRRDRAVEMEEKVRTVEAKLGNG